VASAAFVAVAVCDVGVGTPGTMFLAGADGAALGCVAQDTSQAGYFAFQSRAVVPEYAYGLVTSSGAWVAADIALSFYSGTTGGSVTWSVQTACIFAGVAPDGPFFGPAVTVTTGVGAAGQIVSTLTLANIATNGRLGCGAGGLIEYRIARGQGDSAEGEAYLVGVALNLRAS